MNNKNLNKEIILPPTLLFTNIAELTPIHPEPCDSVKCGKNARCLGPSSMLRDDDNQTNQTLCLCNEGFVGDPYDEALGCQESKN